MNLKRPQNNGGFDETPDPEVTLTPAQAQAQFFQNSVAQADALDHIAWMLEKLCMHKGLMELDDCQYQNIENEDDEAEPGG